MFKRILIFIIFLCPLFQFAQDFSELWEGHFSYYDIKDIVKGNNKVYAASENAVFSLDIQTNELEEITTINGLFGELISTIYYSEFYELLIIGYENGLIEIAFDNDEDILTIVDIIDKPTIPPTDKRINHFNVLENLVYISTDFGISVFDLERLEFGDTYFIGNGGTQIRVKQTTVFNEFIYAACLNGNGLRKAPLSNPNLIDFQNWQIVTTGDFMSVETNQDELYAIRTNRRIYQVSNDVLSELFLYSEAPSKMKSQDGNLLVTTTSNVFVYGSNFNLISQASVNSDLNTQFNSSTIDDENIYIATKDFGVLKTPISAPTTYEAIRPGGPLLNRIFSLENFNDELWGVSGGYGQFYNFSRGIAFSGISHFKDGEWLNIPFDTISSVVDNPRNLSHIAINPFNPSQVFISSFFSGLIEINDNQVTGSFDENNSTLAPFVDDINLTLEGSYDQNGALWLMNGRVDRPLNRFQNNQWVSFDFTDIIADPLNDNLGFGDIVIAPSGTKFIGSYEHGVIGFNENSGNQLLKEVSSEESNMPTKDVRSLALDKRNQLWIGTGLGLRVLFNPSSFFDEDNISVDEIIIEEDGIAKELLADQFISDIEVDGSNNKWIATIGSGAFYLSSDGQQTLFHFTTSNSPLPSNNVNDISINESNGEVFIATDRGLVSYRAGGSSPLDDLESAYAYPNPVRPSFDIVEQKVKIKDISENVNIKITDIEGNLVAEAQSRTNQRFRGFNLEIDGGTAFWNGKNLANNIVASGVYLVMLSDLDTFETKVLKLMVVR